MDNKKYKYAQEDEKEAYAKKEKLEKRNPLSAAEKQVLFRLFEKAGESFLRIGELSRAIGLYQQAKEYAQYKDVKERINRIIEKIEEKRESLKPQARKNLEKLLYKTKKVYVFLSIAFLISALFFISINLTGNVIAELIPPHFRIVGICFFVCGLIFAFIYLKNKK